MTTIITGATGFVGSHLANRLPDAILAGRNPEKIQKRFGSREAREWRGTESSNGGLLQRVDTIFHLAGESIFHGRWNAEKKKRIRDSRIQGTRQLVDCIVECEQKPKTLICSSAVGYYGSQSDAILTEKTLAGKDFLAQVCVDWESEALRAEDFGVRVVLIRSGVVLANNGGALAQMLLPFRLGLGGRLGKGDQFMSWIHINDLLSIMIHAGENTTLRGAINGVAPNPVTNSAFTRTLAGVLHRPAILPAPDFVLKLVLGEFANVLLGSQRAVPQVLQQAGFDFAFPSLKDALSDLLV